MNFFKKATAAVLAGIMMLTVFAGCADKGDISSGGSSKDFPVTVSNITIKSAPTGVVVLSPNIADVILAMGYEIVLKGKSAECTQADLSVLPNVTADDVDAIKKLNATVVLTDEQLSTEKREALSKAGIQAVNIAPAVDRNDLSRLYAAVGAVIKGGSTGYNYGKKTAENIFLTIDDITRVIPEQKSPITACFLYDTDGGAATGDTLAGKLLECAGLTNAVGDCTNGKADIKTLLLSDPQYIFCSKGLKDKLAKTEKYKDLTAVKEKHVYEIESSYMQWQGRELIQAVGAMAGIVFPELTKDTESSAAASSTAPSKASSGTASSSTSSGSASSLASSVATAGTLQKGDKGDDVLKLQKRLDELGYMFLKCSGEYGDGTAQSVKDFQLLNGLSVTGIADAKTQQKIYAADAKKRTA